MMSSSDKLNITDCKVIKYISNALEQFHSWSDERLIVFCKDIHPKILEDYIHIVTEHPVDDVVKLFQISDFYKCNITNCQSIIRRYDHRDVSNYIKDNQDSQALFYRDILDSLHCYLFHLPNIAPHDNGTVVNEKTTIQLNQVSRFHEHRTNKKFCVIFNQYNKSEEDTLFVDLMHDFMEENNAITRVQFRKMLTFFHEEEYDSDCIIADIDNWKNLSKKSSNIAALNGACYQVIKHCVQRVKLREYSFSVGYRFYYWDYYQKVRQKLKLNENHYSATNDYSEYGELNACVSAKYQSLKHEMLNNLVSSIDAKIFQFALNKAYRYLHTQKAKKIKAAVDLHYDIPTGSPITHQHLLSLILYCDFTELCSSFSATFRKLNLSESIRNVKKRNREYYNWSKLLREAVEVFGVNSNDHEINRNKQQLPFFCKVSYVMVPSQFHVRLCAPTSTSKQKYIAFRFGGNDNGILLQLNKDSASLRYVDCSWISKHPIEQESLFCGGRESLRIQNIQIKSMNENFQEYFQALFYFDCMITNANVNNSELNITDNDNIIIRNLIQHKIDKKNNKYNTYINSTFKTFCNSKTTLSLNLLEINMTYEKFADLVLTKGNQIQTEFVQTFSNIKRIEIYSVDCDSTDLSSLYAIKGFEEHSRMRKSNTNKETIHCSINNKTNESVAGYDEQIMDEFDIILHCMSATRDSDTSIVKDPKKQGMSDKEDLLSIESNDINRAQKSTTLDDELEDHVDNHLLVTNTEMYNYPASIIEQQQQLIETLQKQLQMQQQQLHIQEQQMKEQSQREQQQRRTFDILSRSHQSLLTSLSVNVNINQSEKQATHCTKNQKKHIKKQLRRSQKQKIAETNYYVGYEPSDRVRARGQIDIPKKFTKQTIPSKICGKNINWYKYVEKWFSRQLIDYPNTFQQNIIIVDNNLQDEKSGETYYCIVDKIDNMKESRFVWKMRDRLFTKKEVVQNHGHIFIPRSLKVILQQQLSLIQSVKKLLSTNYKQIMAFKNSNISVYKRQNKMSNKQQIVLRLETCHMNQLLLNSKRLLTNANLIPILMFSHNPDAYWIEFVVIFSIKLKNQNYNVGISLKYDHNSTANIPVMISGIHLDKILLFEQHMLAVPNHIHQCQCFDNYQFNLSNIEIKGDLNEMQNKCKNLKQKYESLKTISYQLIDSSPSDYPIVKHNTELMIRYQNGSLSTMPSMISLPQTSSNNYTPTLIDNNNSFPLCLTSQFIPFATSVPSMVGMSSFPMQMTSSISNSSSPIYFTNSMNNGMNSSICQFNNINNNNSTQ